MSVIDCVLSVFVVVAATAAAAAAAAAETVFQAIRAASDKRRVIWYFEHELKTLFATLVDALVRGSSSNLEVSGTDVCDSETLAPHSLGHTDSPGHTHSLTTHPLAHYRLTHSLTHALSHSVSLSLTHSLAHSLIELTLTDSLTHSLSISHSLTHSHSVTPLFMHGLPASPRPSLHSLLRCATALQEVLHEHHGRPVVPEARGRGCAWRLLTRLTRPCFFLDPVYL